MRCEQDQYCTAVGVSGILQDHYYNAVGVSGMLQGHYYNAVGVSGMLQGHYYTAVCVCAVCRRVLLYCSLSVRYIKNPYYIATNFNSSPSRRQLRFVCYSCGVRAFS